MEYHIYHVPGQKIGVTTNLELRVEEVQGYEREDYEILETSDDVDYITKQERVLQRQYGYEVDRTPYKDYMRKNKKVKQSKELKMNINTTEQTTTFPCSVDQLKTLLTKVGCLKWDTPLDGELSICNINDVNWVSKNALTSTYRETRCFIYNKAFARFLNKKASVQGAKTVSSSAKVSVDREPLIDMGTLYRAKSLTLDDDKDKDRFKLIRQWAIDRGLYVSGDPKTQFIKLMEESGELARGLLKNDQPEVIDAIGDMVVVLTNLAALSGTTIEHCIDSAYEVISKRTGKMVDGTFVKDE